MLEVTFTRDSQERLSSVFANGHAGWADAGDDIVCAAVSAILQAARLGLEEYAKIPLDVDQHSGNLRMQWPQSERVREDVAAIVSTAELSVKQIAAQYPEHVQYRAVTQPA